MSYTVFIVLKNKILMKGKYMSSRKRFIRLSLTLIMALLLIVQTGCLSVDAENKNQIELSSDGKLHQTIVDDADASVTGEELENYINDSIKEYQGSAGNVALERCKVRDGKVNIILNYDSAAAYAAFNNVICFNGTLKEAYDAGYDLNRTFYSLNKVEIPYFALPAQYPDSKVLILEENTMVKLPGELLAYSDGVTVTDDGHIQITQSADDTIPEELQVTTASPVFIIYRASK